MPSPVAMQGVIRNLCRTEFRRLYQLLGDSELLARFLAERDEAAFEEIVSRHGPMVRAVCWRMLGATADADDAFQATFLVLIRRARSIHRKDLLANWLCAVAYRTARQAQRRRGRLGNREQNVDTLPEPARLDDPPRDWLPLFDAALQRLPTRYREAVVLCDLQGLSRLEAADKLGLNEGTLSSRLGRGRDLLRKRLVRQGFPLAIGAALAPAVVPEALTASTVAAALSPSAASVPALALTEGVVTAMFASKLKAGVACAAVLFVGAFSGWQLTGPTVEAGGPPVKDGPAPKSTPTNTAKATSVAAETKPSQLAPEYAQLQGEWRVVYAESDRGTGASVAGVDELWKFTGTVLTTGGELKEEAAEKFVVNSQAKPATIDFTLVQFASDGTGAFVRTPYQGIYKFEADGSLQICYRLKADGFLRPKRFGVAKNSGQTVLVLKRNVRQFPLVGPAVTAYEPVTSLRPVTRPADPLNPPTVPAAALPTPQSSSPASAPVYVNQAVSGTVYPDSELLQGVWVPTSVDGKPVPAGHHEEYMEFLKNRVLMSDGTHGRFRLEDSKSPKQITLTFANKSDSPMTGIYKLEGDRLTIASYSKNGKLIPTTFEPDPDAGISAVVYERQKEVPPKPDPLPPPAISFPQPSTVRDAPRAGPSPPRASERDLQKEIDQLREQLRRVENELKKRVPPPGPAN